MKKKKKRRILDIKPTTQKTHTGYKVWYQKEQIDKSEGDNDWTKLNSYVFTLMP